MIHYKMYSDGGSRGNPGSAAVGFVIYDQNDKEVFKTGKYLGKATNNTAEYMALYFGVLKLKSLNCTKVDLYLDSELVVKQMLGKYQVKNVELGKIKDKIVEALKGTEWTINHIRREKNKVADGLVNQVLDANN